MTALTQNQKELLERLHDDDLSEFEAKQAQKLLSQSTTAQDFMESLGEIRTATRVAEEQAWTASNAPSVDSLVASIESTEPSASLEDLAPILERFFDGETTESESEWVAELIDAREDVAQYLTELDHLRDGVLASTAAASDVDFSSFWDNVSDRLDEADVAFNEDQRVLLYRFHDGEVTDDEVAMVNGWVDAGEPTVLAMLDSMKELNLSANVAMEVAQEDVEFDSIWAAVEDAMDADVESQGENVVSFNRKKREAEAEKQPVLIRYRQSVYGAVAAIFLGVIVLGMFNNQLFGPQKVIVEKTIVIVDSVEYAPGASVMINSPVQQASAIQGVDGEVEEPTVIWILDSGDEELPAEGEQGPTDDAPVELTPDFGQPI